MENWGVVCFNVHSQLDRDHTTDDSNLHPENILQWSHYASKHAGMVLAYRKRVGSSIEKVTYSKILPEVDLDRLTPDGVPIDLLKVLLTKHKSWSYEHEYRIINTIQQNAKVSHEPHFVLSRIYFGANAKEKDIEDVKSVTANQSVSYFQTKLNNSAYSMDYHQI